jgi:hypothetical protein
MKKTSGEIVAPSSAHNVSENFWSYYEAKQTSVSHDGNLRRNYNSKQSKRGVMKTSGHVRTQTDYPQVVKETSGEIVTSNSAHNVSRKLLVIL